MPAKLPICDGEPFIAALERAHAEGNVDFIEQHFRRLERLISQYNDEQPKKLPSGVAVPKAFYKILVDEVGGKPRMLAFIMPQEVKGDEPLNGFLVSVRKVEDLTHLDFFSEMNPELEQKLETETPQEPW